MLRVRAFIVLLFASLAPQAHGDDEYERPPIAYSQSAPDNRVSSLQAALERGELTLTSEPRFGYLPDLLKHLEIDPATQMLVFSKTSMQRTRISPRTPRAIYFNDDSYVGYCHAGDVLEIAVADSKLGAVFYTLDQTNSESPAIVRETHKCLQCHGGAQTDDIPGFVVRSLFVGPSGLPILSEGSHRVDQTTPVKNRWGGWYVSGALASQPHLGNLIVRDRDAPKPWKNVEGQSVNDLSDRFLARNYLTPHSDVVALMVFEHQAYVHNLITRASFAARQALHYEAGLNEALGNPTNHRLESTTRRIETAGEKLVRGLFLADEAAVAGPISGSSEFAEQFIGRGPHDDQGRSLRDLELNRRLFKYPLSYLVYSKAFNDLPPVMKQHVSQRVQEILAGRGGEGFRRLTDADRQAITEILRDTKPELLHPSRP